jgi:hypothetical protein
MNRIRKEALKEKLEKLDAGEHAQIFEIVKRNTESYTKTQNNVLISSDVLSDDCLIEIEKLVAYYMDQRKTMDLSRRQ